MRFGMPSARFMSILSLDTRIRDDGRYEILRTEIPMSTDMWLEIDEEDL